MAKQILLLMGLLAGSHILFAQSLSIRGRVIHAETGKPVPFATLGIEGKPIGTVASETGEFNFTIPAGEISPSGQLIVSCIGFEDLPVRIASFKNGPLEIKLEPKTEVLEAVTVRPGRVRERKVGRARGGGLMHLNYYTAHDSVPHDKLAREYGVILPLKHDCFLKDFNCYVDGNQFKLVTFRLNIYAVENGIPTKSLQQFRYRSCISYR